MMDTEVETRPDAVENDPEAPKPEISKADEALVKRWLGKLTTAKKHWEPTWKRMREDMQLSRAGADKDWVASGHYTVPLTLRHINQSVATIYAKNPKAFVRMKRRLDSQIWDGTPESFMQAQATLAPPPIDPMAPLGAQPMAPPPSPEMAMQAMAIVREAQAVMAQRKLLRGAADTLEILVDYFMSEQEPKFKKQAKQLVRRTKICGVGFVELGYQRAMQPDPDITAQIADMSSKIARLETLAAKGMADKLPDDSADLAELQTSLADLQTREMVIIREGPVFGFPRSTEVVVDPECRDLNGFIGAQWVARVYLMTPDAVMETYKVDIKCGFTPYRQKADGAYQNSAETGTTVDPADGKAMVYRIFDKKNQQELVVCEGYKGWIVPPRAPEVKLERFWPWFTLAFNAVEHEEDIYPLSDARILRHPQMEYNRTRQSLREHRIANAPRYLSKKGLLTDADRDGISTSPPHTVTELNALIDEVDVAKLIQRFPVAPVDPALYETGSAMDDVLIGVGQQEANLGGSSGATATEASIAEQSRAPVIASDTDELDDFLSDLVSSMGQLMMTEMSVETVKKIVGPGAVWGELENSQIALAEELLLDIKAGSSGRPNKAAELANTERAMPFLIQMPGVNPKPLVDRYASLLDIDMKELGMEGLASIVAQNAMVSRPSVQPGTGDPGNDPGSQGKKGGENAPAAAADEPGGQPAYPAPAPGPGMGSMPPA